MTAGGYNMDSAQDVSSQDQDGLAGEVNNSLGMSEEAHQESPDVLSEGQSQDPLYVQKRLKQQKRSHEREIRELHARMADMQSQLPNQNSQAQQTNPYGSPGQPSGVDEQIHRAVSYALQHKDMEERKAKEAQNAAYINRQYQNLHKHLDGMNDKYDDFHDVVMSDDAQFTPAMRDYSLTMPKSGKGSAGEVLYNLGKNPSELERIGRLHPIEQANEMAKLSHALISGGDSKGSPTRPLGQIKSNPVSNSHVVNDKTPISSLRERMKSGTWK